MLESLEKHQFQGPQSLLMSNCMNLQDGDLLQPQSQYSHSVPNEISPNTPIKYFQKKIQNTGKQSVFEEELSNQEKPELLKLIIAKSLQNNFINNLWNKSYLRKLHQLSEYQIKTLDDLKFTQNILDNTYEGLDIFTPYSKFIFFWDTFQIILYLFIFFWLPFKQSFNLRIISQLWNLEHNHSIEFVIMSLLSCDVIVGLNMAFIHKGQIIHNRKRIFYNYCKQYAFVDLVNFYIYFLLVSLFVLTFQFFVHDENDKGIMFLQIIFVVVFYVLRLNKIDKILASVYQFLNLNGLLNDLLSLVSVLSIIIFIIHICACVWHGIAQFSIEPNWIDSYDLRGSSIGTRYNIALYWATMTMTTVGYGDVTAKNNLETAVNNGTMLIGSIVFAYSVNSIGIFVSNIYKNKYEYTRSITLINTFMTKNKIRFDLQTRIRSYLQYIWSEEQQMNEEEVGSIVSKLSGHLQDELNFSLKGNVLNQCKIIAKTFSLKFQKHLLLVMEEQKYSPEERIITLNQLDDGSIYIISKGEVEIIFEGNDQNGDIIQKNSLQRLKEGDYFGEISFVTAKPRTASAIARGFVRVFKIRRENFLKILTLFPNDHEKFCQLRDSIVMNLSVPIAIKCYSCKSDSHSVNECHFHHYCPDKEALIKKELYPIIQNRRLKYRKRHTRKHPWQTQNFLSNRAKECLMDSSLTEENCDSLENDIEEMEQSQNSQEDMELLQNRVQSQSISATPQLNDTEDDENKKIQKYMRNMVMPHQTVKTAGFGALKQEQSFKIQSDQLNFEIQQESKKIINSHISKSPIDFKTNQKSSRKRITIIKESVAEEKQNTENNQTIRQETRKISKTQKASKEHHQFSEITPVRDIHFKDFDQMKLFTNYFPINNYDVILKRYAKIQKMFQKKKIYPEASFYSFFILTIKKGFKLRKLGEEYSKSNAQPKSAYTQRKSQRKSKPTLILGKDF